MGSVLRRIRKNSLALEYDVEQLNEQIMGFVLSCMQEGLMALHGHGD